MWCVADVRPVLTRVTPSTIVVNSVVKTLVETEIRGVVLVTGVVMGVDLVDELGGGVLSEDGGCELLDGGGLDVCEGGSDDGGGVDEGGGGVDDGGGVEREVGREGSRDVEVGVVPVPA